MGGAVARAAGPQQLACLQPPPGAGPGLCAGPHKPPQAAPRLHPGPAGQAGCHPTDRRSLHPLAKLAKTVAVAKLTSGHPPCGPVTTARPRPGGAHMRFKQG